MNKPIIALFCKSNIPTNEEEMLLRKYALYPLSVFNVSNLRDDDNVIVDAVCGEVPKRFTHLPTADEKVAEYEAYLKTLGTNVGGQAPKVVEPEKTTDAKTENNSQDPPAPPVPPAQQTATGTGFK